MMLRLPLFAALDADRDGILSEQEIANASDAIKKLDKNEDGKIDLREMAPDWAGRGRGPGDRGPGDRDMADRDMADRDSPDRRPGGPRRLGDGNPEAMLQRLMQRDKDNDGLLSEDEIPEGIRPMIQRADKDGDGKLSRQEIQTAMANRARQTRRGGGRAGGGSDRDAPGGERPKRPPTE